MRKSSILVINMNIKIQDQCDKQCTQKGDVKRQETY